MSLAFGPNSKLLATGGDATRTVRLWGVFAGKQVGQFLSGHASAYGR